MLPCCRPSLLEQLRGVGEDAWGRNMLKHVLHVLVWGFARQNVYKALG